ncbi:MAG TPA: TonB-dependent receptor, partial [Mariniphaga sp.]|nr:TonB-dependent receptor [Mariniphaga sp.]
RLGGELHFHYDLLPNIKTGAIVNYIWSEQLSGSKKGFTLPFSPPTSTLIHFRYQPVNLNHLKNPFVAVDLNIVASQNNIVPPEVKTPGYFLLNMSTGTDLKIANQNFTFNLQVRNLLNKVYFKHTSYYRLINVPAPSRNISVGINYQF